ncbi:hypothetical protein LIER_36601 [Lithospermum erythrorhizon]|uniref:Uncharacterized protein n=1 Tax=Lithospermum erythrorhizon TaxID=34254 RepID=A0AAV3P9B7_LITER
MDLITVNVHEDVPLPTITRSRKDSNHVHSDKKGVPTQEEDESDKEDGWTLVSRKKHHIAKEDAEDAPSTLEEGVKVTVDKLKEINLGTDDEPRPIYFVQR